MTFVLKQNLLVMLQISNTTNNLILSYTMQSKIRIGVTFSYRMI